MAAAAKIKQYKTHRAIAVNRIKKLYTSATASSTDAAHSQFKKRYISIEEITDDFEKYHSNVISASTAFSDFDLDIEDAVSFFVAEAFFTRDFLFIM